MFKQSRKKIIVSIMGSVILLFAMTLFVIFFVSYRNMRARNIDMMSRHTWRKSDAEERPDKETDPNGQKGGEPRPDQGRNDELSTFYTVEIRTDGTVLGVENEKGLHSDEELIAYARKMIEKGKWYAEYGTLCCLREQKGTVGGDYYDVVVFLDNTVMEESAKILLRNVLIVGSAAIVVLFFLSLRLSEKIIRPLEENDKQQGQFISDASHELKTPVAVIDANAELLAREVGKNEWLSNIRYENDRMGELVKQLLDLSRAESAELPAETVDLSRLVMGEELAFESLAFDQGKRILSEVGEDIYVMGSETQLAQLVSVLLDNAVRHSTGEEIALSLKKQGHSAVLTVENDGEAIPEEKAAHLFDRFYRVDEARNSEGQHYGLGLSIAKAVAEKHGGSIGVACADGKVTFTVMIPVKK
ncbi:MAG: HAMP domain-containing histidine kinase [Lachnospiraceae bacterium]|nr:HAMP domain-containing histidine kinase [Lachnospiraceae bacterium]